jgi:hypothetical protein
MRSTRVGALAGGAVVLALAACGSSHSTSSGSATHTAATAAATQTTSATGALALSGRVLSPSTFPGLTVVRQPTVDPSASDWATSVEQAANPAGETGRLKRLGFVGGIDESLNGMPPLAAQAISLAEQYRSPAAARRELAYQVAQSKSARNAGRAKFKTFPVAGIPGAVGWDASDPSNVAFNIFFADGPFFYLVATGYPANTHGAPTRARLLASATSLFKRVHGRTAA